MLLVDPKMVELSPYQRLPHLMHPVVTDMRQGGSNSRLGGGEDGGAVCPAGPRRRAAHRRLQRTRRRRADRAARSRRPTRTAQRIPRHLPYIVIVADEMADLMMTSGKEVEQHIIRLAQKSRAVGIHLILATQKPTVDVITGLIKSNLPARISFQVASRTDSRVVLDEMGADKLLGNGDMLFLWPGTSQLHRGQGTFVSDEEINRIVGVGQHRAAVRQGAGAAQAQGRSRRGPAGGLQEAATICTSKPSISSSAKAAAACRCCNERSASAMAGRHG